MWVEFVIDGKNNFLLFDINKENDVDCVLYNGKDSWHEKQNLDIIVKRAKDLNKRILQLDGDTVKDILQTEKPVEANWIEEDGSDSSKEYSLKLKYRLETYPFNFTWHFSKQTEHDFQQFVLFPLFRIVQGLTQQNEELREIVRKKDREIKQYKTEGAILKIVTVATPTFNFKQFDEKYADSIKLAKRIMQISELLKSHYEHLQTPVKSNANASEDSKKDNDVNNDVKLTPRRRRRKLLEEQERRHAEKIKLCAKTLQYESSQSDQLVPSSAEDSDIEKEKKTKNSPAKKTHIDISNKVKNIIENAQPSSPKKFTRSEKSKLRSNTESSESEPCVPSSEENSDVEKMKKIRNSPTKKPYIDISNKVKNKIENSQPSTPKKSQKDPEISPTEIIRSLRKRKPTDYAESEDSLNSMDISKESIVPEKKNCTSPTQIICQLNTTTDEVSDDIKNIINEWKELEERRVADLKNIRTTRTGKRISY